MKKCLKLLSGAAIFLASLTSTSCIFFEMDDDDVITVEQGTDSSTTQDKESVPQTVTIGDKTLNLVWNDEFDYSGVPDTTKWKYQTGAGGWGNNEIQNYIDNSTEAKTAVVENGYLNIKAYNDGGWKSARLNSIDNWTYGYFEAKLKVTDTKGLWPAFWMMPQDSVYGGWPNSGEIDIMENAPSTCGNHCAFSTLHAAGHYSGDGVSIGKTNFGETFKDEWHTFAVKWDENTITAFYDGTSVGSYTNDGTTKNWPYDQNFYIILNLAVGGNLGGQGYDTSKTYSYLVDYVRVYQ